MACKHPDMYAARAECFGRATVWSRASHAADRRSQPDQAGRARAAAAAAAASAVASGQEAAIGSPRRYAPSSSRDRSASSRRTSRRFPLTRAIRIES